MTIRRVTQGGSAPQAPEVARLNLSRNNRFLVAIGGLAILYLLFTGVGYVMTASERLAIERDAATAIELRAMTGVLRDAVGDQEATIDLYLLSRDPAAIALYEEAVTAETGANRHCGRRHPGPRRSWSRSTTSRPSRRAGGRRLPSQR